MFEFGLAKLVEAVEVFDEGKVVGGGLRFFRANCHGESSLAAGKRKQLLVRQIESVYYSLLCSLLVKSHRNNFPQTVFIELDAIS